MIALAWDLLAKLGVGGLELQLNSLGTSEDRQAYRTALVAWLEQRSEELDPDSQSRLSTNPLRILDSKNKDTQALLEQAPTLTDTLCAASRERFEEVQQGLNALGIPFRLNPRLVRGLDYYSHTAFEITSDQLGAQATVCGGGQRRFDRSTGRPPTSAMVGHWDGTAVACARGCGANRTDGPAARLVAQTMPDAYVVNRGAQASSAVFALPRASASGLMVNSMDCAALPVQTG